MKCYFAKSNEIGDFPWTDVVFAENWKQAKKLSWQNGDATDFCDNDYLSLSVRREKEHDHLFTETGRTDAHVCRDIKVLRLAGIRFEYDESCDACGLATMNDEYPVCIECGYCTDCGHDDGCFFEFGEKENV